MRRRSKGVEEGRDSWAPQLSWESSPAKELERLPFRAVWSLGTRVSRCPSTGTPSLSCVVPGLLRLRMSFHSKRNTSSVFRYFKMSKRSGVVRKDPEREKAR